MSEPTRQRVAVLWEISAERDAQDKEWGGATHDDEHGAWAWIAFAVKQLGKASAGFPPSIVRPCWVKVAAIAVAAIEAIDRAKELEIRHKRIYGDGVTT